MPNGSKGTALVAASHLHGSVAFAWPVQEERSGLWEIKRIANHDECFLPVYFLLHWEVCSITWLAPAEQWQHHNTHYKHDQLMKIRGKPQCDGWTTLPRAAAKQAFWDVPLSTLRAFAPLVDCSLEDGDDTFSVLWALVQTILSLDDEEEILNILMLRQDAITSNSEAVDMFMSLDVEVGQLAHNDAEELKTARENHSQRERQTKHFTDAWVAKKKTVTTNKSLTRETSKTKTAKYPQLPSNMPTHHEAEAWLPPDTMPIWRGLSSGSWGCHYPPIKEDNFTWRRYGGGLEACLACLRWLWQEYLQRHSLQQSDCPISGLFTQAEAPS